MPLLTRHASARTGLIVGAAAIASIAAVAACIPDPEGDYNDFQERSASLAGTSSGDVPEASTIDTRPSEVAVEQLYVGICVTALAGNDPSQALRFYAESKYLPDPSGATNGTIEFTFTPMLGWDTAANFSTVPKTVAKSETRGAPFSLAAVPISTAGRFTSTSPLAKLPPEANSISGRAAEISNIKIDGVYGSGERFCSTLGGQLIIPYSYTFLPEQNTCLFVKATDGMPLPTIPATEFTCSLN